MENWLSVPGYEGLYEVSDVGNVRSLDRLARTGRGQRKVRGRAIRQYERSDGRLSVTLSQDDQQSTRLVHHLVLEAFVCPRPRNHEACHADDNPQNNRVSNLRWDSHAANIDEMTTRERHANTRKDRCPRAHLLELPNLKPSQYARGVRSCLSCSREYALALAHGRPFDPLRADERYRSLGFTS